MCLTIKKNKSLDNQENCLKIGAEEKTTTSRRQWKKCKQIFPSQANFQRGYFKSYFLRY